ncbi:Ig domain-containing protein [Actinosynnema sp. NPDC023794]
MRWWSWVGAVLSAVLVAGAVLPVAAQAGATTPYAFEDRAYTPVTPTRVLDTRSGLGAPAAAPVGRQGRVDVRLAGRGGVPTSGVAAVAINLTGTQPTAATHVIAYPAGDTRPTASNLNLVAGQTAPNAVVVKLGADGSISLHNNDGSVHLIVDVVGWFAHGPDFTATRPARLLDTRSGLGAPAGKVGPRGTVDLDVTGVGGVPAAGVGAVVVNLTGTEATEGTHVIAHAKGAARPSTSTLNVVAGQTVPNLAVVEVGADGSIRLHNNAGSIHLLADVVGWFAIGADYAGVAPTRLFDSRADHPVREVGGTDVQVAGQGGVPTVGVGAVVLNVTATEANRGTYVTAGPVEESFPQISHVNVEPGQTASNMVVVKLGPSGLVHLHTWTGDVHLIVDVVGWLSVGVTAAVDKPDGTEIVAPSRVTAVSGADVTLTGAAPATGAVVFVAPGSASTGRGLLGRVTGTTAGDGVTTVHTQPVMITEAFPSGRVTGAVDTRSLMPDAPPSPAKVLAGPSLVAGPGGRVRVTAQDLVAQCQGRTAEVDADLSLHARALVHAEWGADGARSVRTAFELDLDGALTAVVAAPAAPAAPCGFEVGPDIPLGTIWGFTPTVRNALDLRLSGGVPETVDVSGHVRVGGHHVRGHGVEWLDEGDVRGTRTAATIAVDGSVEVLFAPRGSVAFASVAGPSFVGGMYADSTTSVIGDPWWYSIYGVEAAGDFDVDGWFPVASAALPVSRGPWTDSYNAYGLWPGPRMVSGPLRPAVVGAAYFGTVELRIGQNAIEGASVVDGDLPPGLIMMPSTGVLRGTPTTAGDYGFTVEARDVRGHRVRASFTLPVNPA